MFRKIKRPKLIISIVLFVVCFGFFITPVIIQKVLPRETKLAFIEKIGIQRYEKMKRVFFSIINLQYVSLEMKESKIPQVYISVDPKDLEKITSNLTQDSSRKDIDGVMTYNGKDYNIQLKVKGGGPPHWQNDKKSWGVIAQDDLFDGQSRVDFIIPSDKGFIQEGYSNFIARKMGLTVSQYRFVDLFINNERQGFYYELEHWSKEMVEKQGLTGDTNFYGDAGSLQKSYLNPQRYTINPHDEKNTTTDLFVLEQIANNPDDSYFWDNIFSIIDRENFFTWQVHSVILGSSHQWGGNNIKLYFNNTKGLFEFFPWDINTESPNYKYRLKETAYNKLVTRILKNPEFAYERDALLYNFLNNKDLWKDGEKYYEKLRQDIEPSIAKDFLKTMSTRGVFARMDTTKDYIGTRRSDIEKYLRGGELYTEVHIFDNQTTVIFNNKHVSPASIQRIIFHYTNKEAMPNIQLPIVNIGGNRQNLSCNIQELVCSLDFNNKLIFSGRVISEDSNDRSKSFLEVTPLDFIVNIVGDVGLFKDVVVEAKNAITDNDVKDNDIKITYIDNKQFEYLKDISISVDEFISKNRSFFSNQEGNLVIGPGSFYFDKTIIIPEKTSLVILPNTTLTFKDNVSLLSYSGVTALGTPSTPIKIFLQDGIFGIVSAQTKSVFKNCLFSGGKDSIINGVFLSGMFSVYHSEIEIENCEFRQAKGDDSVNIKYAKALVKNNLFVENGFDALDIDFAKADTILSENIFRGNGNDGIDLSGADNILIENNKIYSSGDKCISVGEKSTANVSFNFLKGCLSGMAVKDSSQVLAFNNIIIDNQDGITLYRKKEIFGGGQVELYNNVLWGNVVDLLKDDLSAIIFCNANIINSKDCTSNIDIEPIFESDRLVNLDVIEESFVSDFNK